MQTFVPYASLRSTAEVLDQRRLGKQRVETLQIMRALAGLSRGWTNHPATRMWRGHETALLIYQRAICDEWRRRGYRDTCEEKTVDVWRSHFYHVGVDMPTWWGRPEVHRSHRSNLLRKERAHYEEYWPHERDDLEYVWPV